MAKRPVSALGNKRPVSEFARKVGAMGGNPRFKVTFFLLVAFFTFRYGMLNSISSLLVFTVILFMDDRNEIFPKQN